MFDHRSYGMLGKLKPRRSSGVGAVAGRHGPLSTSHHLSTIKRSIGGCLSIIVLRIFRCEVFENCDFTSVIDRDRGDAGEARRFLGEAAHAISSLNYCRGVGLGCGIGRALGLGVGLVGRRRINGLNEFIEAQIV